MELPQRASRQKQWLHLSQDFNHDAETIEFMNKFGLAGVRVWIEILSILDRTNNYWSLHEGFSLHKLAKDTGTNKPKCLNIVQTLLEQSWINVGTNFNHCMFIYAPKWLKYNKKRGHDGSTEAARSRAGMSPTPTPKEKIDVKSACATHDATAQALLSQVQDEAQDEAQDEEPGATKPPEDSASGGKRISLRSMKKKTAPNQNSKNGTRFNGAKQANGSSLQSQIQAKEAEDAYRLDRFEKIWALWPKRTKYLEAKLVWLTIKPDDETARLIFEHAKTRKQRDDEWKRDGGRYVPNLANFLENERWTDAIPAKRLHT